MVVKKNFHNKYCISFGIYYSDNNVIIDFKWKISDPGDILKDFYNPFVINEIY